MDGFNKGDTVLYVIGGEVEAHGCKHASIVPAIVVRANRKNDRMGTLSIMSGHEHRPVYSKKNVRYDPEKSPGTWHFKPAPKTIAPPPAAPETPESKKA